MWVNLFFDENTGDHYLFNNENIILISNNKHSWEREIRQGGKIQVVIVTKINLIIILFLEWNNEVFCAKGNKLIA